MASAEDNNDAAEVLAAVPDFAELVPRCASTFDNLVGTAIWRDYDPSQVVFLEGEPCAGLGFVQEGWVKAVKMSPSGREQIVRLAGPGEVLNASCVLAEPAKHLMTVVALEPAKVWIIPRGIVLYLVEQCPRLTRIIARQLAERVQHLISIVEDLSLRSVEARLAHLLLEQSSEELLHRQRWATQAELAAQLGTVPDVLHWAMRDLVKMGLIAVDRHQIHLLDHHGLETKAMLGE